MIIKLTEEQEFILETKTDGNLFLVKELDVFIGKHTILNYGQIACKGTLIDINDKKFKDNMTMIIDLEVNTIYDEVDMNE